MEPLGEAAEVAREIATDVIVADLRAQLKTAQYSAEDRLRQIRQIAKQSADLRAQLQAAGQERDKAAEQFFKQRDRCSQFEILADERGREVERAISKEPHVKMCGALGRQSGWRQWEPWNSPREGLCTCWKRRIREVLATRAATPPAHKEMDAKR